MQAGHSSTWRSAFENPQPIVRAVCLVAAAALIGVELWPTLLAQLGKTENVRTHAGTTAGADAANVEQITAADLFGHAASQNANLPQTDLQVTLRAVFAATDPKAASAVIEAADGSTQMVKMGGAIGSGATLQEVYPNRVVLMRNGALETLYFPTPQEAPMNLAQNLPASTPQGEAPAANQAPGASAEEIKRAAILQRLEELRAGTPR